MSGPNIYSVTINGVRSFGDSAAYGNVPGRVSTEEIAAAAAAKKAEDDAARQRQIDRDRDQAMREVDEEMKSLDAAQRKRLAELQGQRDALYKKWDQSLENLGAARQNLSSEITRANDILRNVDAGQDLVDVGSLLVPGGPIVTGVLLGVGVANDALRPGGFKPIDLDGANAVGGAVDIGVAAAEARDAAAIAARQLPSSGLRAGFSAAQSVGGGLGAAASALTSDPGRLAYALTGPEIEQFSAGLKKLDVSFLQDQFGLDKTRLQFAADDAAQAIRNEERAYAELRAKDREIKALMEALGIEYRLVASRKRQQKIDAILRKHGRQ